jgi:two-component system, response regulator PdtaR
MSDHAAATVLVVEDEPLVLMNAVEMIEEAGWRALEAANSAEALHRLGRHGAVDVLFTDINMPGEMDGLELAARVHELYPHIELVVTSGKRVLADYTLPDDGTFLAKPYGYDDVVEIIGAKLGRA